jgi:2-dehydro-3-deoxyphosphogluconate aldolase/(4S)-4-hydroxy-2-oxoglutarate aldolase
VVLRPAEPIQAVPLLWQLQGLGLHHVEIAWRQQSQWGQQCRELIVAFPGLALGAASVCTAEALEAAAAAGFAYAVSPILEPTLLQQARTRAASLGVV